MNHLYSEVEPQPDFGHKYPLFWPAIMEQRSPVEEHHDVKCELILSVAQSLESFKVLRKSLLKVAYQKPPMRLIVVESSQIACTSF